MRIYIYSFVALCLLLKAHIAGMNGLYFQVAQYDIPMHILGGIGIALAISAAVKLHGQKIHHQRSFVIVGTLIAGILWELFEMYYDITGQPLWTTLYYLDTLKDLVNDTLGGVIVAMIFARKKQNEFTT